MSNTWYKCRKCGAYLFSDHHLAVTEKAADGNGASNSEFHGPCSMVSLHFLKLQGCPSWVFRLVEKGQYLKGKLICPKCCGRVGAFDFIHRNMCECGNHAVEPIHVLKGRVDERKTNGLAFPLHKIPKSLAPELQVAKTLQEAEVTSLEASQLLVSTRHPQGETRASFPDDETVLSPKTSEIGVEMSVAPLNTMTNASRAVVQPSDKCETPGHLTGEKDSDWKSYNKFSPLEVSEPIGENEKNQGTSDQPDEFTCPVCLDVFYHPYNCKPCNHTFCGPCLRRLAAANAANALSTKCPLCRKLIDVCQPNYELTKAVRKAFPLDWQLRHRIERKSRHKLHALPHRSGFYRRRIRASQILNHSAAVLFVTLLIVLGITICISIASFVLWYVMEETGGLLLNLVSNVQDVIDSAWNLVLSILFDGHVSMDSKRVLLRALNNFSNSVSTIFNRSGAP